MDFNSTISRTCLPLVELGRAFPCERVRDVLLLELCHEAQAGI